MSIRISLDNPPEFYTNLDFISGRVFLTINRGEQIGAVVVKLEGDSRTALAVPNGVQDDLGRFPRRSQVGSGIVHEDHKILYKVHQVFPDETVAHMGGIVVLEPGQYEWPFRFKIPFNNICGDPAAMSRIGGLMGAGGYAGGGGLFGMGGIRVMDGSRQLMYTHVTKTLPPSFTGFPGEAEIRYFVKVTIQRPGLFKENWRYQVGFKFLPIEPIRPQRNKQESYARRPFAFRPRSPSPFKPSAKRQSFFRSASAKNTARARTEGLSPDVEDPSPAEDQPPSVEMSARLPYPSILTCNQPIPLRLLAKKLVPSREECYLTSLEINLLGSTHVRCQDLVNTETTRWVVVSRDGLSIPLCPPDAPVGAETVLPDDLWSAIPLPNTVMPSFVTCNLGRSYQLELKLAISWGLPPASSPAFRLGKGKQPVGDLPQVIFLPLHFSSVDVYSGMTPPPALVEAMRHGRHQQASSRPPRPPPRPSAAQQAAPPDPLYPPQLRPGQTAAQAHTSDFAAGGGGGASTGAGGGSAGGPAPPYEEAPPSYDEAMAEEMTGPVFPAGQARPAYSGVTNENAPSSLPEKS